MNLMRFCFFLSIIAFTAHSLCAANTRQFTGPISLEEVQEDMVTDTTPSLKRDFSSQFLIDTVIKTLSNPGQIPPGSDPFQNGMEYVSLEITSEIEENHGRDSFPLKIIDYTGERAPTKRKLSSTEESSIKRRKIKLADSPQKKIAEISGEFKIVLLENEELRNKLKYETALSEDRKTMLSIVRDEAEKLNRENRDLRQRLLREKMQCKELEGKCEKLEFKEKNLHKENEALRELHAKGISIEDGEIVEKGE